MPRIAEACLMRMPPCRAVTAATCAKTCKIEARPRERDKLKRLEARPPHPVRNEWAIGRLRPAHLRRGVHSAEFGTAARCGPRATTDTPASAQPAAAEAAPRDRAAGVAAVPVTAAVADA